MSGIEDVVTEYTDDLDAVVVTHQHSDHVGGPDAVARRFDPDVYVYTGHPLWTRELGDGDHVEIGDESFEVVYTPGHADNYVSLMNRRSLFSGDAFVYNGDTFDDNSFGRTDIPGQSHERLINSLYTLLDCLPSTVETLYAGHGDPFENEVGGDTVRDVFEYAIERAERREPKYPEA